MPKLLIVDDENDICEFARSFFMKRGIIVVTATKGSQAIEIIAEEDPDLVLLDVRMEEMSGIDVLKELRNRNINARVIMVSGVDEDDIINEAKSLGAINYIHKPLILEELERVVLSEFKT